MAGAIGRVPMKHRILTWESIGIECSSDPAMNLSDTVFEFLDEEWQGSPESLDSCGGDHGDADCDEESGSSDVAEDNKRFWENQQQLLKATLYRTSSLESSIRRATKDAIKDVNGVCECARPPSSGCKDCLMRKVCFRLQNVGFDCAVCKSKWKSSPDIPSGEHKFLDVVDNSNPRRGEVRVIIELNFRGEFEMARASEDYNGLIGMLPEVFVGKIERLMPLVKILCGAAKKCMKERRMHMGPWRRHRYVQAKWLRTCERKAAAQPLPPDAAGWSQRQRRTGTSMLTVDLRDAMPGSDVYFTAVEVV